MRFGKVFIRLLQQEMIVFLLLFIATGLYSQTAGKIVGNIKDAETGESLLGANVFIIDTYLGTASKEDGSYIIINVPPGTYDIKVTMIGYTPITKKGVMVSIDRIATVDFFLKQEVVPGEEVIIVAERDILHKEVSNSQLVVTGVQMVEAAGVRTVNHFLEKQPGVTGDNHLEIRGGSAEQTGTIVNGVSFVNARIGKAEATVPLSAIEQISLVTGGFNAEYGNYRSGLINVTTKSGYRTKYKGTFTYTRNIPFMKRFGKSLYDPSNFGLRPYLDPVVSFQGTKTGWLEVTGGDEEAAKYLEQSHESFRGWNDLVDRFNRNKPAEEQATPMDLYLWAAWMHMIEPDFDKLEELYPEYPITDAQKKALKSHAHEPEDSHADYNFDGGFGGPIPYIGKYLGNATFYISNQTNSINYIQPVTRNNELTSTTFLTVKSNISKKMTLNLNGIYRLRHGIAPVMPSNGDRPTLEGGGGTMYENNIDIIYDREITYFWHPTFYHPKDQTTILGGLKLNYVVNEKTFWDLSLQYGWHKDFSDPEVTRDFSTIINFGPIWVDEMPYGRTFGVDTVYNPMDPAQFYMHSEFEEPYGINRRYNSKTGEYHENSVTQQIRVKYDLSSQVTKHHYFKTGAELNYYDLDNDLWTWWQGHDTNYELRFHRKPWILGGYLQDQFTLEGLIAVFGLRFDYFNSGGDIWPTGDRVNEDAFTKGTEGNNPDQLYEDLASGKSVIWERWHAIDDSLGNTFLEETENFFTISPRLGISFPVTERSKFYFNYGHFRATPPYSEMFMFKMRYYKQGLYEIGNPNLEPPRTIQYELGVSYNLLDQYLVNINTYYKDVTGQHGDFTYINSKGTVDYDTQMNNEYEDIQGFEVNVTKAYGTFLTGWVTYRYMIEREGNTGREELSDDPAWNEEFGLYESEEDRPTTRPVITGNITLHTPGNWGPKIFNYNILGGWMISFLGRWERGETFTWNPADIRNVSDNLRWPDYYMLDLKVSKRIDFLGVKANLYVDINNFFNIKVNWMYEEWCFRNDTDHDNYLASLKLPMYDDPRYDQLRKTNPGLYIAGDDKPGDLRSDGKSYINDPDNKMWLYGYPRDIWFGININF
jgi:hypothetical protein